MTHHEDINGLLSAEELKDLKEVWVDPFSDDEIMGEHALIVALLADIEERKAREAKAVEALEQVRYLIDFAPTKEEGAKEAYKVAVEALKSLSPNV